MAVVLDDHLLLDVLAGLETSGLARAIEGEALYATGCWFYRLSRAAVAGSGQGSLSSRMAVLSHSDRQRVLHALGHLPPAIGLLNHRVTVPVMTALRVRRPLNMLNAEALAVAIIVDGSILVRVDSELLRGGAADLGVDYRLFS